MREAWTNETIWELFLILWIITGGDNGRGPWDTEDRLPNQLQTKYQRIIQKYEFLFAFKFKL